MHKDRSKKLKFDDFAKIRIILVLFVVALAISMSIPSLARFKNYVNLENMFNEIQVWDGEVATDYNSGSGTEEDPYIIKTAAELAYFAQAVNESEDKYEGKYFELGNHIVLNNGLFGYDETNISYEIDGSIFYIAQNTNNVYETQDFTGNIISNINTLDLINEFKGHFNGNYYTIYGLYVTGNEQENAFINTLSGVFENTYFENAFVYGGSKTSVLTNNAINATIKDILVEGNVVGTGINNLETSAKTLNDITVTKDVNEYRKIISFTNIPVTSVTNVKVTGNYTSSIPEQLLTINGSEFSPGEFSLDLDPTSNSIEIVVADELESEMAITNLKVTTTYEYAITSGISSVSKNTTYTNIINKANIYGTNPSGLVGKLENSTLTRGYNNGIVKGESASAIVGQITLNSNIAKTYNTGVLSGTNTSYVDTIYNNNIIAVSKSFSTTTMKKIFNNYDETFNIEDVYHVNTFGTSTEGHDKVNVVTQNQFTKELMINTLGLSEFQDNNDLDVNPDNAWIYAFEKQPILYMDSLNNPIASLNIGTHSWNDLGFDLTTIKFSTSKAFNVTPLNGYSVFEHIYYYIHEGKEALSRDEINSAEWQEYTDVVPLDKEGYYVIYIKIEDQTGKTYYINSDCIFFDLLGPNTEMTFNREIWDTYKSELETIYINAESAATLSVDDEYSDVLNVYYYISNSYVTIEELQLYEDWIPYENSITIDKHGVNVINIKAVDINGNVTYVNSDYIIYGGYESQLKIGVNSTEFVDNAHITDKSSVIYSFSYNGDINYAEGYYTNLVSSQELPVGTTLTLINNKSYGVYTYTIKEEGTNVYRLSEFKTIGNISASQFDDITYIMSDEKDISIIVDFSQSTNSTDFSFDMTLELKDNNESVIISTLEDSIKETFVYSGLEQTISISSETSLKGINYDSDSTNTIDFEYELEPLSKNKNTVIDTTFDSMKTGIAISLNDGEGSIVNKKYLKNMEFIINNQNYCADSDGIVRINMSDNLNKVTGKLIIITHENDFNLKDGNYSLVITPFVSSDGKYSNSYSNSNLVIPVVSTYKEIYDYDFNVIMDDSNKILTRATGTANIPFNIVSQHKFKDASIKVALYKKNELTAYDQSYSLIDLNEYSTEELELVDGYHTINTNEFALSLNLSEFEKNGYEIRFELYDGDIKIETIKKKFIIK